MKFTKSNAPTVSEKVENDNLDAEEATVKNRITDEYELNEEEIGLYQQWENYKAQKDFENADVVRQALIAKGVL